MNTFLLFMAIVVIYAGLDMGNNWWWVWRALVLACGMWLLQLSKYFG